MHLNSLFSSPCISSSNFFMYILLASLSLLSLRFTNSSIVTALAIFLIKPELRQFISIGSLTTSQIFSLMNCTHSSTSFYIPRKSEEMRIEMTFFRSKEGGCASFRYFISHSKILISQWTEISMSSKDWASCKYCSKYFIWERRRVFSHVKSLFTFLFSSNTWITISSYSGTLFVPWS